MQRHRPKERMRRRLGYRMFMVLVCLALIWQITGCDRPRYVKLVGKTMGTHYEVVLPAVPSSLTPRDLTRLVEREFTAVIEVMSTYERTSAISRFNAAPAGEWFDAPQTLANLVAHAESISEATLGRFDVTVGPLVDAWGFGASPSPSTRPTAAEVATLMTAIGWRNLDVDTTSSRLRKRVAGVRIDLNAIAKGHAVDVVAARLESVGLTRYLVDVGGEIRVSGAGLVPPAWRVGIEHPDGTSAPYATLAVSNVAVATSGDYRNFFIHDGSRYSHTIDPTSGYPIPPGLASVSVVHRSAASADGYATGLMALGARQGLARARDLGLAAYFIERHADGFRARVTPAMRAHLSEADLRALGTPRDP